jgi:hypothetical protein
LKRDGLPAASITFRYFWEIKDQMEKTIKRLRDKYQYFKGLECADDVLRLCAEYEKLHNDHRNLLSKIAEKIKRAEGAIKKA